jgi:hypothetical protein
MRMKILPIAVLVVVMIPLMFIVWYRWDSARNRGSEFGYYGEFNRVSNALASIPGVTITRAWQNRDVSLEEFGFSMSVTGRPVTLAFSETDPIREMSRNKAVAELKMRIATELPTTN